MKKIFAILFAAALMFSFAACTGGQNNNSNGDDTSLSSAAPAATALADSNADDGDVIGGTEAPPTVLNSMEYTLYTNIFYNADGDRYVGNEVTKKGTFTVLHDKFNNRERYYVWGYNDATKCCDWQWELVLKDDSKLPSNGSLITAKGTFAKSSDALDGYWIEDAEITVEQEYVGPDCDVDMTAMGATLERVQIINMQNYADDFKGQKVYLYGRVFNKSAIQNPYYDDSWTQDFVTEDKVPATGTCVIVAGTFNGVIDDATVTKTKNY